MLLNQLIGVVFYLCELFRKEDRVTKQLTNKLQEEKLIVDFKQKH
jgi:hypothetical protein